MDIKNLDVINVNVYKPELSHCPLCMQKLVYKYATNNKKVQFRNGEVFEMKNLAYTCKNNLCDFYNYKFTSQSVNRLCSKGCTYSTMMIWSMIYFYKFLNYSVEKISYILSDDSIQICDKNILILIKKNYPLLSLDFENNINIHLKNMRDQYNCTMLFVNLVDIEKKCFYLNVKNAISNEDIGSHFIESQNFNEINKILKKYFSNKIKLNHLFIDLDNIELMNIVNKLVPIETKTHNLVKYRRKPHEKKRTVKL